MKKLATILLFLGLLLYPTIGLAQSTSRDMSDNAMIYGGVYSTQELKQKMANGDGVRSASELQQDFASQGVTVTSIQSTKVVNGYVTKGGRAVSYTHLDVYKRQA